MENNICITIISSIFEGIAGVLLAGIIIWAWQRKYIEKKNKTNILFERKCKEEDLFYVNFRKMKHKIYEMFLTLTSDKEYVGKLQDFINEIVSSIQECINQINISEVPLSKYKY